MKIMISLILFILPVVSYALDFKQKVFTMQDLAIYKVGYNKKHESFDINTKNQSVTYKYDSSKGIALTSLVKKYSFMPGRFIGTTIGIKKVYKGIVFIEVKNWKKIGEKSIFYKLKYKNKIVGSAFVAQRNKFIFSFVMVGIDLNNTEFASKVLVPKIRSLK